MKRWLLHLRDLTMRITLAQSPRLAARDLMEMVISHSEIDAMRLSRCPQGDPWRPDAATLRDKEPRISGRRAPPAGRRAGADLFSV